VAKLLEHELQADDSRTTAACAAATTEAPAGAGTLRGSAAMACWVTARSLAARRPL